MWKGYKVLSEMLVLPRRQRHTKRTIEIQSVNWGGIPRIFTLSYIDTDLSLSAALQDANCPSHNVLRMVAGNQQHAVEKADNYEPSIVQY